MRAELSYNTARGPVRVTVERQDDTIVFAYTWPVGSLYRVVYPAASTSKAAPAVRKAKPFLKTLLLRPDLVHHTLRHLYRHWVDLVAHGITRRVASWASKAAGENYADILAEPFLEGTITLYAYRVEDGFRIRLGDLGDGIELLIAARMAVEYGEPQLILWDDVEAHMNPRTLQLLALWLAELVDQDRQVVVSTHSLEAASTIAELHDETTIVRLALANGRLTPEYYSAGKVDELKQLGIDVRA